MTNEKPIDSLVGLYCNFWGYETCSDIGWLIQMRGKIVGQYENHFFVQFYFERSKQFSECFQLYEKNELIEATRGKFYISEEAWHNDYEQHTQAFDRLVAMLSDEKFDFSTVAQ